ncbi:hypothetical protein HanIR_Chr06g0290191 [Helianthus annuus]|nr:hypothetical protein HanIR_Chr06g0290191 [Helianthus annuus]
MKCESWEERRKDEMVRLHSVIIWLGADLHLVVRGRAHSLKKNVSVIFRQKS